MMLPFSSVFLALAATVAVCALPNPVETTELFPRSGLPNINGTSGGYYYLFSSDGVGTVTFTNEPGGEYAISWANAGSFIGGKGWNPGSSRTISYTAAGFLSNNNVWLSVYGWTTNPLVEYYIVDTYGAYNPASAATFRGTVTTDGGTYGIYVTTRVNQPSIQGTATFQQVWSIRTTKRTSGGTITTGNHFNVWAASGVQLGTFNYQLVATTGSGGSGHVDVTLH